MKTTIYNITDEFLHLMHQAEESDGELTPELNEQIMINESNFVEKAINIVNYVHSQEDDITAIDEQIKRLTALKKSKTGSVKWLKGMLANSIDVMYNGKYDGGVFKISVRRTKSVDVFNEELISDQYKTEKTTLSVSKTLIKEAIESGVSVAGASIVESISLQIK